MCDRIERVEELIQEIQLLKKQVDVLQTQNVMLRSKIHSKEVECEEQNETNKVLKQKMEQLEQKLKLTEKKHALELRHIQNKVRKNDLFRKELKGSSKTKKEQGMVDDMVELRRVNGIMLNFIEVISKKLKFDAEVANKLCEIADGCEDKALQAFISGIKRVEDLDVPLTDIVKTCASSFNNLEDHQN